MKLGRRHKYHMGWASWWAYCLKSIPYDLHVGVPILLVLNVKALVVIVKSSWTFNMRFSRPARTCTPLITGLSEFLAISALKLNSKLKNFGTYGMEISLTQEFNIKCIRCLKLAGTDLVWGSNKIKQNLKQNMNVNCKKIKALNSKVAKMFSIFL